ncbi:MAG: hypothetical protein R3330_16730, partial [Saprospiraceae bacterium]|nr:hypothetical protein [Saprospiraceae bacterium]
PPALDETAVNDLVEIINLLASARDAMSDEMVSRIALTASEGITLLDRLLRNEGLLRLLQVLDHPENQQHLISLADALSKIPRELATIPPARGGIGGLWKLAREPGIQEGVRALSLLGQYWGESLREMHRRGVGGQRLK